MASEALTPATFAGYVDHTLLKPEATRAQVEDLAHEGAALRVAAVCVNGLWARAVTDALRGSGVATCAVVGFPLGAMSERIVAAETEQALADGATEIDMVIPVGPLRGGDRALVSSYVAAVRAAAGTQTLKVILETALLTEGDVVEACRVAVEAGADFVKTSTGFNPAGGATARAVRLMRETVGPGVGVKASGGIRSLADARNMLDGGASRLGMSATAAVLRELEESGA